MPWGVFLIEDTEECRRLIGDCVATAETQYEATQRMMALYKAGDFDLRNMGVERLAKRAWGDKVTIALEGTESADYLADFWRDGVRPIRRECWPPSDHPNHGMYARGPGAPKDGRDGP